MTPRIELDRNTIFLFSEYRDKDRCKSIAGARWNAAKRCWQYSLAAADAIIETFPELSDDKTLNTIIQDRQKQTATVKQIKASTKIKQPEGIATKLWLHQLRAVEMARTLDGCMLALSMGTGKSLCAVSLIAENADIKLTLIVCPLSVCHGWQRQFEMHAMPGIGVAVLKGSVKERETQARRLIDLHKSLGRQLVLITNYEATFRAPLDKLLLEVTWDLVVADESHKLKSPGGRTSKFFQKLGAKAKKRLCLTGTPLPNSILDAYGQYRFLAPSVFGTSIAAMRSEYCVMGGYQKHEVIGYRNRDKFNSLFYSHAYRVMADDVLDLPPVIHVQRFCELSPECRSIYKQLKKDLIAQWEAGEVTAANGLVKLLRLSQITGGFATLDDGTTKQVDTAKLDALREVLDDLPTDEPLVIFARFRADIDAIMQAVRDAGRLAGELSGHANGLKAYQSGDINTLIVQVQSGGVGIELQHCGDKNTRYCAYYSVSYSLAEYEQSLARVHRPGQKETVTYIHIIAQNTVDEKIYTALESKKQNIEEFLTELKEEK